MKVICPQCNTVYNVPSDKMPKTRTVATCKKCGEQIVIEPSLSVQPEPRAESPTPTAPDPAPSTTPQVAGTKTRQAFPELSFNELKKLKNYSHNIGALGVLWSIGAALSINGLVLIAFGLVEYEKDDAFVFAVVFCLFLAIVLCLAVIGLFTRTRWGRGIGIGLCAFGLLGFPIGTIISIIGLIALTKDNRLFGKGRYLHKDLKKEYKFRKKNKII